MRKMSTSLLFKIFLNLRHTLISPKPQLYRSSYIASIETSARRISYVTRTLVVHECRVSCSRVIPIYT